MPKINIETKPLNISSIIAARISFASAVTFLPYSHSCMLLSRNSTYHGDFLVNTAWPLRLAYGCCFFITNGESASLFVAIRTQIRTVGGYMGIVFFLISAIGFGLAAVFITDPIMATTTTTHGSIHSTGALLGAILQVLLIYLVGI